MELAMPAFGHTFRGIQYYILKVTFNNNKMPQLNI